MRPVHQSGIWHWKHGISIGYDLYLFRGRLPKYVYIRGVSPINELKYGNSIFIDPFIHPQSKYVKSDVDFIVEAILDFCEEHYHLFYRDPKLVVTKNWMGMADQLVELGF